MQGMFRSEGHVTRWSQLHSEKQSSQGPCVALHYSPRPRGSLYENGLGAARDYNRAREWYEKAIARSDPSAGNLVDLIAKGKLVAEIRGLNIGAVVLRVRRIGRDPDPLPFNVPLGTFFTAGNPSSQNMVSIAPRLLTLANAKWLSIAIPTACANMMRKIPKTNDRFTAGLLPDHSDLFKVIRVLHSSNATPDVVQAAVWIITDNATFDGLGTLVNNKTHNRTIGADDAARAMKLIDDAGIDITEFNIWLVDRTRLVGTVTDKLLANWLSNASSELLAAGSVFVRPWRGHFAKACFHSARPCPKSGGWQNRARA